MNAKRPRQDGGGEGVAIALHSQTHINNENNKEGLSSAVSDILHETIACITTGFVSHWGTISLVLNAFGTLTEVHKSSSDAITSLATCTADLELQ